MTKIYIVQSYNTTENDIYNIDPDFIENIITDTKEQAEKICDYIDEYNERMTGVYEQINGCPKIVEIDLGDVTLDPNAKCFETIQSVKETHPMPSDDTDKQMCDRWPNGD